MVNEPESRFFRNRNRLTSSLVGFFRPYFRISVGIDFPGAVRVAFVQEGERKNALDLPAAPICSPFSLRCARNRPVCISVCISERVTNGHFCREMAEKGKKEKKEREQKYRKHVGKGLGVSLMLISSSALSLSLSLLIFFLQIPCPFREIQQGSIGSILIVASSIRNEQQR